MYRLIVFDLDGTLAALGKGIEPKSLEQLKALKKSCMVAVYRGKNTSQRQSA